MMSKRLSLVERQQKLIEERRWWSGPPAPTAADAPLLPTLTKATRLSFAERQDAAAIRQGRGNATAASRRAAAMPRDVDPEADDEQDGSASIASHLSHAPSLHPSMTGTVMSKACSEVIRVGFEPTRPYPRNLSRAYSLRHFEPLLLTAQVRVVWADWVCIPLVTGHDWGRR